MAWLRRSRRAHQRPVIDPELRVIRLHSVVFPNTVVPLNVRREQGDGLVVGQVVAIFFPLSREDGAELHRVGCAARIVKIEPVLTGGYALIVACLARVSLDELMPRGSTAYAKVSVVEPSPPNQDTQHLHSGLVFVCEEVTRYLRVRRATNLAKISNVGVLADVAAANSDASKEERLLWLEMLDTRERVAAEYGALVRQLETLKAQRTDLPRRNTFSVRQSWMLDVDQPEDHVFDAIAAHASEPPTQRPYGGIAVRGNPIALYVPARSGPNRSRRFCDVEITLTPLGPTRTRVHATFEKVAATRQPCQRRHRERSARFRCVARGRG